MSTKPLSFLEKKWISGWGNSNRLVKAAVQTTDRKVVPRLDNDFHRNISAWGRTTLLSTGRFLYENCAPVRSAVNEMSSYSVSSFVAQFAGKNEAWGALAEAWIKEHNKIIDLAGWNFPFAVYRQLLIKSVLRDGDFGTVLVKNKDGYPFIQTVSGHRIRSALTVMGGISQVEEGEYKGERIVDGVIVNSYSQPLAYRVCGENTFDYTNYTDVSADDMILSFVPNYAGQVRGLSVIATAAFDFSDANESRSYELLAQKLASTQTFLEENTQGGPMTTAAAFSISQTTTDTDSTATGLIFEKFDPGTYRYARSNTGAKITAITADRPTLNQREFQSAVIRDALNTMGWSIDLADPTKAGGAQMRVVVEKINRSCAALRAQIAEPAIRRIDGWRVSVAIKLGLLPDEVEWWNWVYQGPEEMTADQGHATDAAIKEIRAGLSDAQTECARRGEYWEEVQDRNIAFEKRLQEKCKEAGVDANRVMLLTPNGNPVEPTAAPPAPEDKAPTPGNKAP